MDFAAIPRPAFGRHAQHAEDKSSTVFRGKAAARRMLMFRDARELLAAGLPAPGEAVHSLMLGRLDLAVLLAVILDQYPSPCRRLRVATLAFAKRNAVELLGLLESQKVARLTLVASAFFQGHNKELCEWFIEELSAFPGSTIAFARSHCKVCAFDFQDGTGLVWEGSANLRTNSNQEQMALINDRALHDWHALWIDALVNRAHEE